ncbi:hypothetical protein AD998_19655 [bacterium 336/3]|nr:hypothetical protein AD998_19655 [bacterium 336/3]
MYKYIGAKEILKQVSEEKAGKVILSQKDIIDWISDTNHKFNSEHEIIATFVIDLNENLRINDRRSEHVVCANGEEVLSAGEITFKKDKLEGISISQITNQSTGYCPSAKSWEFVKQALLKINIDFPDFFTTEFIFSVCKNCGIINIVKDEFYYCLSCESDLEEYT